MANPAISDIGIANGLRPGGAGWRCMWSQIIAQAPVGKQLTGEAQLFRFVLIGGNQLFGTAGLVSPQNFYDQARVQRGRIISYLEIWNNPPGSGLGGYDDYQYVFLTYPQ